MDKHSWLKDLLFTVLILLLSTVGANFFWQLHFQVATIVIIYMLAVLIITQNTSHFLYGIISSFISVLTFNYFFIEPLYTFQINQPDYIFTFFILLVASIISSTMTSRLIQSNQIAETRLKQIELLGEINQLFSLKKLEEAMKTSLHRLSQYFMVEVIHQMEPVLNQENIILFELVSNKSKYGFLLFKTNSLLEDQRQFAQTLANLIAQQVDHHQLQQKQVESDFEIREQKLKNNLLGAISHDLRTPLATIVGSTEILVQNDPNLNGKDRDLLLHNILDDARWLIDSVQNILSFIQVDEHLHLNRKLESIEELFGDVIAHVTAYAKQHIEVNVPKENVLFPMDIRLMEKVLINLLNNAIKYSPEECTIYLNATVKEDRLLIEVCDEGSGIPDALKEHVFDRFITVQNEQSLKRKGLGLGLAICKAIVEAHEGRILIRDNQPHGSIFRCTFPYEVNDGKNSHH